VDKKYRHLNTKETKLYTKTSSIYRPSHHELDTRATVVVCEGQLDALAIAARAAERGASHMFASVAVGTASISSRQTAIVSRLHPRPSCIALDNDERGIKGALKVATAFLRAGREVIAASLPEGDDPASWLAKHPDGLEAFDRNGCLLAEPGGNAPAPIGRFVVRAALRGYMEHVASGPASADLTRAREFARDLIARFGRDQPSRDARERYVEFAAVELATNKLGTREAAARWLNRVLDLCGSPADGVCPLDTPRAALSAAIGA
jgi:hypothetical protein